MPCGAHVQFYEQAVAKLRSHIAVNKNVKVDFKDGAREDVCAIAFDTKGPEIRTGVLAGGVRSVPLKMGATMRLHTSPEWADKCTASDVFIDYARLPDVVKVGGHVMIDDGNLMLTIRETNPAAGVVVCNVFNDSSLSSRKGVNLPGALVDLPAVSEKDVADLQLAAKVREHTAAAAAAPQ